MEEAVAALRLADRTEHPALDDRQFSIIDRREKCFLDVLAERGDLLYGETVEDDFFTYTTSPFQNLPAGTAVLRRTTNMADLYYVVQNVAVTPAGRLKLQRIGLGDDPGGGVPFGEGPAVSFDMPGHESLATKAAKSLATGLAGAIGGAIGGAIWEAIFPAGVPQYFDEAYQEISRRINQSIREETTTQINGSLVAVRNAITDEYRPKRKASDLTRKSDREALFRLLQKYDTTYLQGPGGMLGTLMDTTYANGGLGVFLLGAGLHLAIYQESALVDPDNQEGGTWRPATRSSYAATVASAAERYVAHAKSTWSKVQDLRRDQIKYKEYDWAIMTAHGGAVPHTNAAYYDGDQKVEDKDLDADMQKDGSSPTRDRVKASLNAYRERKLDELSTQLSHPATIYAQWEKLLTEPISKPLMQT
jgi:hypothetical protein